MKTRKTVELYNPQDMGHKLVNDPLTLFYIVKVHYDCQDVYPEEDLQDNIMVHVNETKEDIRQGIQLMEDTDYVLLRLADTEVSFVSGVYDDGGRYTEGKLYAIDDKINVTEIKHE